MRFLNLSHFPEWSQHLSINHIVYQWVYPRWHATTLSRIGWRNSIDFRNELYLADSGDKLSGNMTLP